MTDEVANTAQRQGRHQEHRQDHGEQHDERFPRERRLRSAADFAAVRQRGRRINSAHLMLSYARRSEAQSTEAPTRVGFSVNKRVGDAVRRNLVKRRLREQVRRFLWNVAPAWDMIITAKPGAAEVDFATLGAETLDIVTRAHLFVDDTR